LLQNDPELPLIELEEPAGVNTHPALRDYYICRVSRELSNFIRRDVLTGRAKFGISDDGKELYQVAMARAIARGDWRADYYRGHTLLMALGLIKVEDVLAQLYADAAQDEFSRGRQMVGHHSTRTIDEAGKWVNHLESLNVSSGTSPTAGQMARGLGLALASKLYRTDSAIPSEGFSHDGDEIIWSEIGDASTSEGVFWETMNAAGVLQVPLVVTVVDDGYGISVPKELQTTKGSISEAMAGLQVDDTGSGIDIYKVKGWDYPALMELYPKVAERARETHRAALVHVSELTQPNGHSTSGSHERYKSKERLAWEKEWDCLEQFRHWLIATEVADAEQLLEMDKAAKKAVKEARKNAWDTFIGRLSTERDALLKLLPSNGQSNAAYEKCREDLMGLEVPLFSEVIDAGRRLRFAIGADNLPQPITQWLRDAQRRLKEQVGSDLYSDTEQSPLRVPTVPAEYDEAAKPVPGYKVLQDFFRAKLEEYPNMFAFGEDVGQIGDVNQGFAGLQDEFGKHRVFDTGIREWTILGQAMGMAMRGMRPIAEIQYLDYIFYAMSMLADDIATLRWRSAGTQSAPAIIRTRGHRLEGIWHSGSYLASLVSTCRGMHICVPRNMVQATGMYNTLLQGDDPALVVEVLNGYRLREHQPTNYADFTVPLGVPECLREGTDLTILTYGACVRVCMEAAELLEEQGIEAEVIDVQTLLPFDLEQRIVQQHLRNTNRLLIVDEDAPGGTSAFLSQQILEVHGGYQYLDAPVKTLTGAEHRPGYADEGDYASKPQVMDVVEAAIDLALF
jgi:pyruvate/2-oxoglutarate/acetoin dehydrogenase E1 component/TPP-dependent pyruvate/acetoin dehydrogenase alpha subunit